MLEASWSSGLHFSGFKKVSDLCVHPKWKKVKAKCALQDVQKYKEHKNEYRGHWMSIADEHVTPQFEVDKCSQRIGVPADVSYFFAIGGLPMGPCLSHTAHTLLNSPSVMEHHACSACLNQIESRRRPNTNTMTANGFFRGYGGCEVSSTPLFAESQD